MQHPAAAVYSPNAHYTHQRILYIHIMNLKPILSLLLATSQLPATAQQVTGNVSSLNSQPVQGVNIMLMGTNQGTAADMNGNFKMDLPEGPTVLLFMFAHQKPVEHAIEIRRGYQYQVNVAMANKTQTFNKGSAVSAELPVNAPEIHGKVTNHDGQPLAGIAITQDRSGFKTISNMEGRFELPMPTGNNHITFSSRGSKEVSLYLDAHEGIIYNAEVIIIRDTGKLRDRKSSVRINGAIVSLVP